jgi:PAS domain S-box-containing protein
MENAAGIYARVIFPDVVSQGDPHLSDLQKAMLDATPDCIKVVSTDGTLLTMNRAGCQALGIPQDSAFGMPWLPLLPEEVHAAGQDALAKAAAGQAARFPGKSIAPGGTVYWDNLLTPLADPAGRVLSILCISRDVTEKTLLERQLADGLEREKLLSREMQHRIKNLFSVVGGLTLFAEKEAASSGHPEAAMKVLRGKLDALARASDAVFATDHHGDGKPADLEALARSVMKPYGDCCVMEGRPQPIRRDAVTTFALFLHELATNSVKYGALSTNGGQVAVRWSADASDLHLTWSEAGGPVIANPPQRRGFGSQMVERIVRASGGTLDRHWHREGLSVDLCLPDCLEA